jgi:lipopolysaccharide/colanic/teichoic acid biosynthesis glycosyltransferase
MYYLIIQVVIYFITKFIDIIINNKDIKYYYFSFIYEIFMIIFISLITEITKPKLYQVKFKYVFSSYYKFIFLILFFFILIDSIKQNLNYSFYLLYLIIFLVINAIIIYFKIKEIGNSLFINEINKFNQEPLIQDANLSIGRIPKNIVTKLMNYDENIIGKINEYLSKDVRSDFLIYNNSNLNFDDKKIYDIVIVDIKLNSQSDLNFLLQKIYDKLKNGGIAIFFYLELEDFENKFLTSKFTFLKYIKILFYYVFLRAFPKIPYLNKIFNLIKLKERVISRAEVWGRLTYTGFEIEIEIKSGENFYLIVKKIYERSKNPNPSFYPIIKLNRVGLNGKIIKIHKLRSMYPYSEFIQKKVFEQKKLNNIGKFQDDFRISKFGKFIRKYWLDELPQLYDWLRGEIKLVGIRAMSQHFFSLYPEDYKQKYLKVKPGIISPIFDEKTSGFSDIVKIEEEYLDSYLKNPMITDIKYFFKTISQILSGVRSK